MKHSNCIAIDGPAGAGKSTVARLLAEQLGILYLDTGAMYRAIGLKALQTGTPVRDFRAMDDMLKHTQLDICFDEEGQRVLLDGHDVTRAIRTHAVSRAASDVSALPAVRHKLVDMQRKIASKQDLVLDGRDIGTYVLPGARFKFFLTADVEERARRRLKDLRGKGDHETTFEHVLEDVQYRDKQDSERAMAPLKQARDAVLIDTTHMTIEEVVGHVLEHVRCDQG